MGNCRKKTHFMSSAQKITSSCHCEPRMQLPARHNFSDGGRGVAISSFIALRLLRRSGALTPRNDGELGDLL